MAENNLDPAWVAIGEHIANMPDDELVAILTILKLDTTGSHEELANRVLAHTDNVEVAKAWEQVVNTPKSEPKNTVDNKVGGGWYYNTIHKHHSK